ncbi:MAG TPA: chloride channel protein, partial [Vicinamibacterales bacterium]|nr:chloride channel protein [Vicinamibacterales bacterium]
MAFDEASAPEPRSATRRLRFIAAIAFVALGAALFAVGFRVLLALVYRSVFGASNVVESMQQLPRWLRLLVPALGGVFAGLIGHLFARPSQGVSNVMEAVALGNVNLSLRTTAVRVLASWGAIATGLSIGREGPLIEFGGSLGAVAGRLLGSGLTPTRILVAAGTAAGFAAAYNTPFAAVLFVVETIVGIAAIEALLPTMTAVLLSATLTRAIAGGGPIYGARSFVLESPLDLISFVVLGVLAAIAALCFKQLLEWLEQWLADHPIPQPARASIGGLIVGAIIVWVPEVAGNGYEPLNLILDQQLPLRIVVMLLVMKVLATSCSVASGIPGGIFTAMLLVGGAVGALYGHAAVLLGVASASAAGSYVLVGMAATTAASIHAPLTAAVLVFELSGDYPIVLPLLLVTVIA